MYRGPRAYPERIEKPHDPLDGVRGAIWPAREQLAAYLRRYARGDEHLVEDAVSEAMAVALSRITEIEGAEVPDKDCGLVTRLYLFMRPIASSALSRERRAKGRAYSLDAPISEEIEDGDNWSSRVTYRRWTADMIESSCDARKIARIVAKMTKRGQDVILAVTDGMTAEAIALEFAMTPGEARTLRANVIKHVTDTLKGQAA